jgi:hypothetical protein
VTDHAALSAPPVMMGRVTDYTALVAAAAHAVGPVNSRSETAWLASVERLAVELAFTARQVEQKVKTLDESHPFSAYLEKVEIEETSRRGLLTLRPSSGIPETIRTEQETSIPGRDMIARARELEGHWVLVYRHNEPKTGSKFENVRMVARLMDLGEGTLANHIAREVLVGDARGNEQQAAQAWRDAGLPLEGSIPVADLEPVRRKLRGEPV